MNELSVLRLLLMLFGLAAVLSVWFSVWAWIVGPAVRHLGKCWGQGLGQGLRKPEETTGPWAAMHKLGVLPPRVPDEPVTPPILSRDTRTSTAPARKFTITGKEIR